MPLRRARRQALSKQDYHLFFNFKMSTVKRKARSLSMKNLGNAACLEFSQLPALTFKLVFAE